MQAERLSCSQVAESSAALAVNSVEPGERAALEAHLADCRACSRELDELTEVLAQLALALPRLEPPPAVGERLLSVARQDRESRSGPLPLAAPGQPGRSLWGAFQRWSPAFALGALAVALAALIWGASLQSQLDRSRQQLAAVTAQLEASRGNYGAVVQVLASQETQVRELQAGEAAPGARGKVWINSRTGQGMLMARDLPPLPEGQGYQVWLANDRGRISPGFLRPYAGGVYYLVLNAPDPLTDYSRVGVTREPLPGSPGPTTPRIVGAEL